MYECDTGSLRSRPYLLSALTIKALAIYALTISALAISAPVLTLNAIRSVHLVRLSLIIR